MEVRVCGPEDYTRVRISNLEIESVRDAGFRNHIRTLVFLRYTVRS